MRCAACHHSFDALDDANVPAVCPECGSEVGQAAVAVATAEPMAVEPISFEQAEPVATESAAKSPKAKRGSSRALTDMLVSLLFVGAIVVAVASTLVAMRAMKQRDEFKAQAEQSDLALGQVIDAAANSSRLKGPPNATAREEIFGPAISYYQQAAWEIRKNPENLDRALAAYQRSAGLQAKAGKGGLVGDLKSIAELLDAMKAAEYDVSRYPSLNQNGLKSTTPTEWVAVKDTPFNIHIIGLLQSFQMNVASLESLARKYPENPIFRDDLAAMQRISGSLQSMRAERHSYAMVAWEQARDTLETLVREQPNNMDFQVRLVEALTSLANLQKQNDKKDEAIANLKRAVEVREQMSQANPDDKALADELAKAKGDLAKLEPAG